MNAVSGFRDTFRAYLSSGLYKEAQKQSVVFSKHRVTLTPSSCQKQPPLLSECGVW